MLPSRPRTTHSRLTTMRRADRLFQIIQLLRATATTTAAELAAELEVSDRTIYRDIQDLMASGVPIEGEAGVGYQLPAGFDLPPLMFSEGELEALVAGVRMVEAASSGVLARHARSVLAKVEGVLPDPLRERLNAVSLYAPDFHLPENLTQYMEPLRSAIATRLKIRFAYTLSDATASERKARPLGLFYWGKSWTVTCWCELREDFRNFRTDRMSDLAVLDEAIPDEEGRDLATFLRMVNPPSPRPLSFQGRSAPLLRGPSLHHLRERCSHSTIRRERQPPLPWRRR